MFQFYVKIICFKFLFLWNLSFIESQFSEQWCANLFRMDYNSTVPTKIYSRSSQFNVTYVGENTGADGFDMSVSYDNVPRINCAHQSMLKVTNVLQLSCTTNSTELWEDFGRKLDIRFNLRCRINGILVNSIYPKHLKDNLTMIDPVVERVEPLTLISGHLCDYRVRYAQFDPVESIPTPVEFGPSNGVRCIKKTDYSQFRVRKTDVFTCRLTTSEPMTNLSMFLNGYYWRDIQFEVHSLPHIIHSTGLTFAGAVFPIHFIGVGITALNGPFLQVQGSYEVNHCSIVNVTHLKCDCCSKLNPVDKQTQVTAFLWSHGNQLNIGRITFQQNPTPNRESVKSHVKDNKVTITIDNYLSHYIPATTIKVYDDLLKNDIVCRNISMDVDLKITCVLDSIVSSSRENHRLKISIGSWNTIKNFEPETKEVDLFFFKVIISFAIFLLLIYALLYLLIRYKFKKPFNSQQVAFVIKYYLTKMFGPATKSIKVLSKKSFTSLRRSKSEIDSKSKSNPDKVKSKSLPKLKGILKQKSVLTYKSGLNDVTSMLSKSQRSLVMESKSSSDETRQIHNRKLENLPKLSMKNKFKAPSKTSISHKKSSQKTKTKSSTKLSKQFKH